MKTDDLTSALKYGPKLPSGEFWLRMLCTAAKIVNLAGIERMTYRIAMEKSTSRDSCQMEFSNDEERR